MALNGLLCADVPLRNYSLTHLLPCSILYSNIHSARVQVLDEVVNAAKEACNELESCETADELVFDSEQRPSTGNLLRQ